MEGLFPDHPSLPLGFQYHADFISAAEEERLLSLISTIPLRTFHFQGYEARRRVASFGYDYSFDSRKLTKGAEIPDDFKPLIHKVSAAVGIRPEDFAELLVTEYPAGSVINWHRDAPPFDVIAGVSLLSDCIFRLRPHEKARQSRASVIAIPVRRRSLYIIRDVARSAWEHSIMPVRRPRYSITLRTLRINGKYQGCLRTAND